MKEINRAREKAAHKGRSCKIYPKVDSQPHDSWGTYPIRRDSVEAVEDNENALLSPEDLHITLAQSISRRIVSHDVATIA